MINKVWKDIDWTKVELDVYNLQKEIFIFSAKENLLQNKIETRKLQKLLVEKEESKLLAIRKITQDSRKKTTAGFDDIKIITQTERIELLSKLQLNGKADLTKRAYTQKFNNIERQLSIPTISDRIKQTLVMLALEPEWESVFESNSFGYRPCYSAADAKWAITRQIQGGAKFVLDGAVIGRFDSINHTYLLNKLNQSRMISRQIESWLKAGILNEIKENHEELLENSKEIPQDSVLSFLLFNIALHGIENCIVDKLKNKVKFIRYLDNFLVFGQKLEDVQESKLIIEDFLKPTGLIFSDKKTKIVHSMEKLGCQNPGFDFLGFHFVNQKCSKNRGVKNTWGVKQPFIQKSVPSIDAIKRHKKGLKFILSKYKNAPLKSIVGKLSLKIKGWTDYFSISQSTHAFSQLDGWLWKNLWKWSVKRYKTAKNAKSKCWSVSGWKFGFKEKNRIFILNRHDETKVKKHIKIKSGASLYNGELEYFAKRVSLSNTKVIRIKGLFKKQNYSCAKCKSFFKPTDVIEIQHSIDNLGNRTNKIEFVHRFCNNSIRKN